MCSHLLWFDDHSSCILWPRFVHSTAFVTFHRKHVLTKTAFWGVWNASQMEFDSISNVSQTLLKRFANSLQMVAKCFKCFSNPSQTPHKWFAKRFKCFSNPFETVFKRFANSSQTLCQRWANGPFQTFLNHFQMVKSFANASHTHFKSFWELMMNPTRNKNT